MDCRSKNKRIIFFGTQINNENNPPISVLRSNNEKGIKKIQNVAAKQLTQENYTSALNKVL